MIIEFIKKSDIWYLVSEIHDIGAISLGNAGGAKPNQGQVTGKGSCYLLQYGQGQKFIVLDPVFSYHNRAAFMKITQCLIRFVSSSKASFQCKAEGAPNLTNHHHNTELNCFLFGETIL